MVPYMKHLPIWRDANLMMLEVEQAVRAFPRYHKYTIGSELRGSSLRICQLIHRAYTRRQSRHKQVQELTERIEDLKMQIQLAKELKAFKNFAQFQRVAELSVQVGKQAGGWLKQARAEVLRNGNAVRDLIHCAPASP